MHWEMIGVLIGAMSACSSAIVWFVRTVVRDENATQLKQINGTYVRSMGSNLSGAEIGRRLEAVDDNLSDLAKYAHEELHRHANELHKLKNANN